MKVQDAMTQYLMDKELQNLTDNSIASYHLGCSDFAREYGTREIEDIAAQDAREYIYNLRRRETRRGDEEGQLSDVTIKQYFILVKAFFNWAVGQRILDENPFDRVPVPKVKQKVPETITDEKLVELFEHLNTRCEKTRLIFEFFLDTGVRASELINLDVEDVHIDNGWALVQGKGRRERIVPLGDSLCVNLHRYLHEIRPQIAENGENAFFITQRGTRYSLSGVCMLVTLNMKAVDVPGKVGPHKLRHTFATNYLRGESGDLESLRRIMGHRSIETTQGYLALQREDLLSAHKKASPLDKLRKKMGKC